ncbi:cobalt-precorrin-5B (C1)-methyltransferase [Acetoanaerobium pronyense]|uniref:Cobalt-precorrin-5B C(1)-methyltransferase n=1 Tax=Acetoanaerobium pronyense TaxID=1482736 RepID=A0ABS4KIS4_9FIRM|nr:cobalt-precorrin-5B (C(1))-methyltransferase CbiD [Acetoanaerobium pronyense]MBP2027686.1 cobalt-precorrin-5B (C1)-methyltransferase [Acetoanaerobium pronyense]
MEFYEKQLGYVNVDGKKLRRGFTTGSAAAAAVKGACSLLKNMEEEHPIELELLSKRVLYILPKGYSLSDDNKTATCSVLKYAGDDPDVTNDLEIIAKVSLASHKDIFISGGVGVGTITKKGLQIPPGRPAINPKPLELITKEAEKLFPNGGIDIEISVPNGIEISKKTFNPRLGIEGGISILGTTGIVEPMSEEALKSSLRAELVMKKRDSLGYTFGNMGEKFIISMGADKENICICSNFIGYMLREGAALGIKDILIGGHIGKIVKLAGGIFNTHSHVADAKNEIIASNLALMGAPLKLIKLVMDSLTAEEALSYIRDYGYESLFDILANIAAQKAKRHTYDEVNVEIIIFDLKGNPIGTSRQAEKLLERLG